ncbi:MAG: hypothetical protein JOZ05_25465 [Acetobacteraceae bacterium]|nr:hypothetical protein [Acetobacteraceae bacterium]
MRDWARYGPVVACAGLIAAPALWALLTQLGLILPHAECSSRLRPLLISALITTLLVFASAWVSWRAPWPGRTGLFTARMSALLAISLSAAMLLQSLASAMLTGCER